MKKIFESGEFSKFRVPTLTESRGAITEGYLYDKKTTVFLSHKHNELDELKDIIGFLKSNYSVNVYIDSQDTTMPQKTSGKTAENIKNRILQCRKFLFLATNGAVESKWCNWELGYGDAAKFKQNNICIFPVKPKTSIDNTYLGNEYMLIYPYISYYYGNEYVNGKLMTSGYYVCSENEGSLKTISLDEWFRS